MFYSVGWKDSHCSEQHFIRSRFNNYCISYLAFSMLPGCFSFIDLLFYLEFIWFIFFNFMSLSVLCLRKISIASTRVSKHRTHLISCAPFYYISSIAFFRDCLCQENLTQDLRLCLEFSLFFIEVWPTLMYQSFSLFLSSTHYLSCKSWTHLKVALVCIYFYPHFYLIL